MNHHVTIIVTSLLLLCCDVSNGQMSRPPIIDVGKNKPVELSIGEQATCGYMKRSTYCYPPENSGGYKSFACEEKTCDSDCPGRRRSPDMKPDVTELLTKSQGNCVELSFQGRKKPSLKAFKFKTYDAGPCVTSVSNNPRIVSRGSFTLTVWLNQAKNNFGSILEKIAFQHRRTQTVFTIMVGQDQVVLQYMGVNGQRNYKSVRVPLKYDEWQHLAIQVADRSLSVFVNGMGEDGTPAASAYLDSQIMDINSKPRAQIGARFRGSSQFLGKIQEFRWYTKALTNREIHEIATGEFPALRIMSDCLCPAYAPRVHPLEERYCIANGRPDTRAQKHDRLNKNAHPAEFLNDDDFSTVWISAKDIYLQGGFSITIDLHNGEYEIYYVILEFFNSIPLEIVINRISNSTNEREKWQEYAVDCQKRFHRPANGSLYTSTDVSCIQFPPERSLKTRDTVITFSMLPAPPGDRPGANNIFGNEDLMLFMRATKVIIFFREQYFSMANDVNTHHQFYALRGIRIMGRCFCHGHARTCDTDANPYRCGCDEKSFTEGNQCERCQPLYNNKPFRMSAQKRYDCQRCECNNHATKCHYNSTLDPFPDDHFKGGGGVCDNCKHSTTGRFCETCTTNWFRPSAKGLQDEDVCERCRCNRNGVVNGTMDCEKIDGQCSCKSKVQARRCHECIDGYFNLTRNNPDGCEPCGCDLSGTVNRTFTCHMTKGQCYCKTNVEGKKCDECKKSYKLLANDNPDGCEPCNCNATGSQDLYCNPNSGQCLCKDNVQGLLCNECKDGFWGLSETGCQPCDCDVAGTTDGTFCNKTTGQCVCRQNTESRDCGTCKETFYSLHKDNPLGCESCGCDQRGSVNSSLTCDFDGQCECKENVKGRVCNLCRGNTFGLRVSLEKGCEPCDCDPKGTALGDQVPPHELVCDSNSGQCACLPSREGRRCDQCSEGFYLPPKNESGCLTCNCHEAGSLSQYCDPITGKCPCKPPESGAGVSGRRCDECMTSYFNFHRLFGTCEECGCNDAGSEESDCDPVTGNCRCKGNVVGRKCDECKLGSSFLTASNPLGCYSHPQQQAAPTIGNYTSNWVELTWIPPDMPNGDQLTYKLLRGGDVVYTVNASAPFTSQQYNDTDLLPYTEYDYEIETSNIGGIALSSKASVRTLAGVPTGIPPLEVTNVRSREGTFEWAEPEVAHGPIETYVLQSTTSEDPDDVTTHYQGSETRIVLDALLPFTNYTFVLRACTSGGCGDSLPVVAMTTEDYPAVQLPPVVTALSNSSLRVDWEPPEEANGIIIQYELMMRGKPGPDGINNPLQKVIFRDFGAYNPRKVPEEFRSPIPPPKTNFTAEDLSPYTEYEFLLSSWNSLGSVQSNWITGRTLEGAPLYIGTPHLEPISSSEVNITWEAPDAVADVCGEVTMYQVILLTNNSGRNPWAPETEDSIIYSGNEESTEFVAEGFQPFTDYTFKLRVCNSVGCVVGNSTSTTTLPAAPTGQKATQQEGRTNYTIQLEWPEPEMVNGPRPDFHLIRSRVSFSHPPIEMQAGVRFPGNSYILFSDDVLPRDASYTGIELHFRTFQPDALFFFAASPVSSGGIRQEYVVLQLRGGRPWFLFDPQNQATAVTTNNDDEKLYNDGKWHKLEAKRFDQRGFIELDDVYTGDDVSSSGASSSSVIGVNDGVYVGGIPLGYNVSRPNDVGKHRVVEQSLVGCIKRLRVQHQNGGLGDWIDVGWDTAKVWHRAYPPWHGCPKELDRPAAHFLGRGYMEMGKKLESLGAKIWTIEVEFRTDLNSGILFYASGLNNQSFVVTTLNNDSIRCIVSMSSNQMTEVVLNLQPSSKYPDPLCNGRWHNLIIQNMNGYLQLQLDSTQRSDEVQLPTQEFSVFDLKSHLYLGGHPNLDLLLTTLDDDARSFGGCIGRFVVDGNHYDLIKDVRRAVLVDLDGCPKNGDDSRIREGEEEVVSGFSGEEIVESGDEPTLHNLTYSCLPSPVNNIYEGKERNFTDYDLNQQLFTRFMYKISSSNDGGVAEGEWVVHRSGEGIPETVPAPYDDYCPNGREVQLKWKDPVKSNGVVLNFTVHATVVSQNSSSWNETQLASQLDDELSEYGTSPNSTFDGDIYEGSLHPLLPHTKYQIRLHACTRAGCATSIGALYVTTPEEAPEGVLPPEADVEPHNMTARWRAPDYPNGDITNYTLFLNGSEVYTGLDMSFTIPHLTIFTAQTFKLRACTNTGCNISDDVTILSGQLPPSYVDQPMVTVQGPHTVELRWLEPAIMNGVFKKYQIFIRENGAADERVLYESTDNLFTHRVDDLVAGTLYHIVLAACTGGGCTRSHPTPCRTDESIPDQVPAPNVTSSDPTTFDVSWEEPLLPNGRVTLYTLYRNDEVIHTSTDPGEFHVTRMRPYSVHEFRVRVCTSKGCSYGPFTVARTLESSPEGKVELSATVLGPRSLETRWSKPLRENGKIIYHVICIGLFFIDPDNGDYNVERLTRDMLQTNKSEEWIRVDNLLPFTDYIVKVNASNSAGYVISNMRTVSMPPGKPDGVDKPHLLSTNPYSMLVSWKDTARNNAPGNSLFQLQYRATFPPEVEVNLFEGETRQMSYNLTGLLPYKEYEFQLLATNPYGTTSSGWNSAYTLPTNPSSVDPPIAYNQNPWTVRVTWEPPAEPNGIVTSYQLWLNDKMFEKLPGNLTQHEVFDLEPFTTYTFCIEACTSAGCTKSENSDFVTTLASAPEDLQAPILRSDTPSSVFIRWSPPRRSNGVLDNYILERRHNDSGSYTKPKFLGAFVPSQSLRFLDESDELKPYHDYEYRVISSTLGGGSTTSKWSEVQTRAGRPGGITPPNVKVLTPTSVQVNWTDPIHTNGPIIRYEISFPEPKVVVDDVTIREYNVTGLIPFTDYQVRITACTSGGCSESPSTHRRTLPDVPDGLDPPVCSVVSERVVSVQWKPPSLPNGPDIRYELSRKIIAQPLVESDTYMTNISTTLYSGADLLFDDRTLQRYTTCEYRVSVFNSIGSFTSDATIVTTNAGYPHSYGTLYVAEHNHTSVLLWWDVPTIQQLQGSVRSYTIRYNSTDELPEVEGGSSGGYHSGNHTFDPDVTSWRCNELYPSTEYIFVLDTDNGAHVVTSPVVTATTDDGAPIGVRPPVIYPLSPSQLRVSWLPPEQPNGQIVAYNLIIDDVTIIETNMTDVGSFVVDDLEPYFVYSLVLEACTVYACSRSNVTQSTTLEAPPSGVLAPDARMAGVREVQLEWKKPVKPNGILRNFQLQRREMRKCGDRRSHPEGKFCLYFKCYRGEKLCGEKCYDPTKQVCCRRTLYDVNHDKECCEDNYVATRERANDVCCGGMLHSFQDDHQCCSGRYLQVRSREICCRDPAEDRVAVGVGDSCCGGIPYFDNGLQLCCGGMLYDGFDRICCGGELSTNEKICCGDERVGATFGRSDGRHCCGLQYLPTNTTTCCRDEDKKISKAHLNDVESEGDDRKCCSTNLIPSTLACCNGVAYDPSRQICADAATLELNDVTMPQRCGSGMVCSLMKSMYAACDSCSFDRENFDCFRSLPQPEEVVSYTHDDICPTAYVTIYSGPPNVYSFLDVKVDSHSKYQYKILAENQAGVGESSSTNVTTPQHIPQDVSPPEWSSDDRNVISLTWKKPKKPNGVITRYALMRDGLEIWTGMAFKHTDSFDILSYRRYEYILKACTHVGCGRSPSVFATSVQGVPESVNPPSVVVINSTSVLVTWSPPPRSNGLIQRYSLNDTRTDEEIRKVEPHGSSPSEDDLTFVHTNLRPHTRHSYVITACTSMGCTSSDKTTVFTAEAPPEGVWELPESLTINRSAVEVFWQKPRAPNGNINEYRLFRRQLGSVNDSEVEDISYATWKLVTVLRADDYEFTDILDDDQIGSRLQYQLMAINGAGSGFSDIHNVTMPTVVPITVPTQLTVEALGASELSVSWVVESEIQAGNENGSDEEVVFNVYVREMFLDGDDDNEDVIKTKRRKRRDVEDEDEHKLRVIEVPPDHLDTIVDNLKPFTPYKVRVGACFADEREEDKPPSAPATACNVGEPSTANTLSVAPSGQQPPELEALGSNQVQITWQAPSSPNGPITGYRVMRRETGENPFEKLIYHGDQATLSHVDNDVSLRPYTSYQYQVVVSNEVDETTSGWSDVTTLEDAPEDFREPHVEAESAFAVDVSWEEPRDTNGPITSYRIEYQELSYDPTQLTAISTALTTPSTVHNAVFSGLKPFTNYQVRVVAVNRRHLEGYSDWAQVTTLAAPPSEVGNLTAVQISDGRSLLLSWDEPAIPNGQITNYNLYEVGFEETPIYTGLARQFLFRRLSPNTEYQLVLEACTGRDLCARSIPAMLMTAETAPEDQPTPTVKFSNATAVMITWIRPPRANGRIISYQLVKRIMPRFQAFKSRSRRQISSPNEEQDWMHVGGEDGQVSSEDVIYQIFDPTETTYSYSDTDLKPYTRYKYKVRTTTGAGFVDSDWVSTETHQAAPTGLQPPHILHPLDNNPTTLVVTWELPDELNGILQTFRLQRDETTSLSFPVTTFRYTDDELLPYTVYSYTITACTAGGCSTSESSEMRTYEEAPLFVDPPFVAALNSSTIEAIWRRPDMANGVITKYRIYVDDIVRYDGLDQRCIIPNLHPYTVYNVLAEACTVSGCRKSLEASIRTSAAPPEGMKSPQLHVTSPNSIEVIWQPPLDANGIIKRYEVRRDGELVFINDGGETRYHDFRLLAGSTYSYVVTAYNNEGKTSSPVATETTDPSAPAGLMAPRLSSTSSSSIRANWDAPRNPNGNIVNYTLSVTSSTGSDVKTYEFGGNTYMFEVRGLHFFHEYIFWLKACTTEGCATSEREFERTLTAPPADQHPPSVVLPYPDQQTMDISWKPPLHPNGIIDGFKLYRRQVVKSTYANEPLNPQLIANLTDYQYTDQNLLPYSLYQYKIISMNLVGEAPSPWSTPQRSGEGRPEAVPEPDFRDVEARSVRVLMEEPEVKNGLIRKCHVYIRPSKSTRSFKKVSSGVSRSQTILQLTPYTSYEVLVEMCTLDTLCTRGPPAVVTTSPAPPYGQEPPRVDDVTGTNISLSWDEPLQTNGEMRRYEIELQRACPHPHQSFDEGCMDGSPYIAYSGLSLEKNIGYLTPYTRYKFRVSSFNLYGQVDSEWRSVVTKKLPPVYVEPFIVSSNVTKIYVDWSKTFMLNSVLSRFDLYDRNRKIYSGLQNYYYIRRTAYMIHTFKVVAITDTGSADSPEFNYDPALSRLMLIDKQRNSQLGGMESGHDVTTIVTASTETPFYETFWFVTVCAVTTVIVSLTILALAFRTSKMDDVDEDGNYQPKPRVPLKLSPRHRRHHPSGFDMTSLPPYSPTSTNVDFAYREFPSRYAEDVEDTVAKRTMSMGSLHRSNSHLVMTSPNGTSYDEWMMMGDDSGIHSTARRKQSRESEQESEQQSNPFQPVIPLVDTHL